MGTLNAILSISKWYAGGGVGIAAAIAIIVYFPMFRKWAIAAIVLVVAGLGIYTKGVHDDSILAKAKREAAERAAINAANRAHTDAERSVDRGVRDPLDTDK